LLLTGQASLTFLLLAVVVEEDQVNPHPVVVVVVDQATLFHHKTFSGKGLTRSRLEVVARVVLLEALSREPMGVQVPWGRYLLSVVVVVVAVR